MRRALHMALAGLMAVTLSACEEPASSPRPAPREAQPAPPKPVAVKPSKRSQELASYYAQVQRNLLARGLLRVDGGGIDTPFSKRQLVENFIRVALFNEFTFSNDSFVKAETEGFVYRWDKPVRIRIETGASVPEARRKFARERTQRLIKRLSRASGHPISLARDAGNFTVAILSVDELEAFAPRLQTLFPGLPTPVAENIVNLQRSEDCVVFTFPDQSSDEKIHSAIALIRAEHPDVLFEKCLHEEITQGLGLINDSPAARPSIFNDDDEFALLTRHDEILLQMLYDDRLPLGADPARARPVIEVLASEILGGDS